MEDGEKKIKSSNNQPNTRECQIDLVSWCWFDFIWFHLISFDFIWFHLIVSGMNVETGEKVEMS